MSASSHQASRDSDRASTMPIEAVPTTAPLPDTMPSVAPNPERVAGVIQAREMGIKKYQQRMDIQDPTDQILNGLPDPCPTTDMSVPESRHDRDMVLTPRPPRYVPDGTAWQDMPQERQSSSAIVTSESGTIMDGVADRPKQTKPAIRPAAEQPDRTPRVELAKHPAQKTRPAVHAEIHPDPRGPQPLQTRTVAPIRDLESKRTAEEPQALKTRAARITMSQDGTAQSPRAEQRAKAGKILEQQCERLRVDAMASQIYACLLEAQPDKRVIALSVDASSKTETLAMEQVLARHIALGATFTAVTKAGEAVAFEPKPTAAELAKVLKMEGTIQVRAPIAVIADLAASTAIDAIANSSTDTAVANSRSRIRIGESPPIDPKASVDNIVSAVRGGLSQAQPGYYPVELARLRAYTRAAATWHDTTDWYAYALCESVYDFLKAPVAKRQHGPTHWGGPLGELASAAQAPAEISDRDMATLVINGR